MKVGSETKFIAIPKNASSLHSLIADGNYRSTTMGRQTWNSLIGSPASLQPNCVTEGFNVVGPRDISPRARIGIIANDQNNCGTPDSRIGFRTRGAHDDSNTCGNVALYGGDNGDRYIKAMGNILVQ